jgi:hypothetical protein
MLQASADYLHRRHGRRYERLTGETLSHALAERPLLVPSPVLGEIGYLLQSRVGPQAEVVSFLNRSAQTPVFTSRTGRPIEPWWS